MQNSLLLMEMKFTGLNALQPLQYSCLENPRDRIAWKPTVHEVTKRHDSETNTQSLWVYKMVAVTGFVYMCVYVN